MGNNLGIINKLKQSLLLFIEFSSWNKKETGDILNRVQLDRSLVDNIKQKHREYISGISSPDMALSLQTSLFLLHYCILYKPHRLVDLGSGFSSYVLRLYQKMYRQENIIVFSVDDHVEWLLKTQQFIVQNQLDSNNIVNLEAFIQMNNKDYFDLVFLDLNFVEQRKKYLQYSIDIINEKGILIVDDVHKVDFLREVKKIVYLNNLRCIDIKRYTLDEFGRFALGLRKK